MSSSRSRIGALVSALVALLASTPARSEDHVFVPCFEAVYSLDSEGRREWVSHVHAFNATTQTAFVRLVAVHVPVGFDDQYPLSQRSYAPGTGAVMPLIRGRQPFFNEFEVPPGVVVSAEVEKVFAKPCAIDPTILGQGRVPLPVYRGLFPAGIHVVTNTIALGNPRLTPDCVAENEKYFRRVNVTLFNGGDEPGTFTIKVLPLWNTPTPIYETTVTLAAKEVRQVNRLPIPIVDSPETFSWSGVFVWMVVTCDQPFLGYASTIFDDPEPGAQPFEVFEFKSGS